jgi:DsbC/DsbD-like thiol-disulfide interchange protein
MNKSTVLTSLLLSLFLSAVTFAQAGNDKVKATSLADVSAIQPGKPFWLGVQFTVEPGWHIYWKNPGEAGLATQVKLKLADGFTAGELQFPIPARIVMADSVCYGYENQVMLMVQITPPKDLPTGNTINIAAKATWLVCKEDCMPGSADVSIELPVAATSAPANDEAFKKWSALIPVKNDPDLIASSQTADSLTDGNGNASITINWKKPVTDLQFFPGVMKTGDISNVKITTADNTTKVTFDIKNKKNPAPVTGLVAYTRPDGTKSALEISIPSKGMDATSPQLPKLDAPANAGN